MPDFLMGYFIRQVQSTSQLHLTHYLDYFNRDIWLCSRLDIHTYARAMPSFLWMPQNVCSLVWGALQSRTWQISPLEFAKSRSLKPWKRIKHVVVHQQEELRKSKSRSPISVYVAIVKVIWHCKQAAHSRFRLFGIISGMMDPENYNAGHCDVVKQ